MFKNKYEPHKHLPKIIIVFTMLVFAVSAAVYVYSYSRSIAPDSYRSFTVSSEGNAITVPDVAQFTLSVITEGGMDVPSLQAENTEKNNNIIKYLKDNGVDEKDIRTQSYNLSPRYNHYPCRGEDECRPPEIIGYQITQSVSVKVRDFDKAGVLLGGVVEEGANSVSQLNFTLDDPTSVQDEARAEAIEKAQKKAKSVAKAGGFRLGKLLSIEESSYSPQPMYAYESRGFGIGGAVDVAPTIEPGSEEVTVSVILRYEIK